MAGRSTVSMNAQGRLTVPAAARQALRVENDAQFEWEVRENELVLRPVVMVPREDAWAYRPEHLALIARARRQVREGGLRSASEEDLEQVATGGDSRTSA